MVPPVTGDLWFIHNTFFSRPLLKSWLNVTQLQISLTSIYWWRCSIATIIFVDIQVFFFFAEEAGDDKIGRRRGETRSRGEKQPALKIALQQAANSGFFRFWTLFLSFLVGNTESFQHEGFFSSSLGKYFLRSFSPRYQGRCKGSVTEKGKMKSPFRFGTFSGLVKLNEEVRYCSVKNWKWMKSTFRTIMLNEIYKHLVISFLKFQISASSPFLCLDQEPLHLLRSPGKEKG